MGDLISHIWHELEAAVALTNFATLGTALLTGIAATYAIIRRQLRHHGAVIARLEDDLKRRDAQLDLTATKLKAAERQSTALEGRLADAALAAARKEWGEGKFSLANRSMLEWIEAEGEPISELLLQRAEWTMAHACGDRAGLGNSDRMISGFSA